MFKVLTWNANGITSKLPELLHLLRDLDIDLALIQETKISPSRTIKIPSYHVIRTDRPPTPDTTNRPAGGVAILIHRRHCLNAVQNFPAPFPIETAAATVPLFNTPVTFVSLYNPPTKPFNQASLRSIFTASPHLFVAGDFNAKHQSYGCLATNRTGISLTRFLNSTSLPLSLHVPTSPTHYSLFRDTDRADILDFGLSLNVTPPPIIDVLNDLSSDHLPVLFTFIPLQPTLRNPLKPHTNWRKYYSILSDTLPPPPEHLPTPDAIEEHLASVNSTLSSAATSATTPSHQRRRSELPPNILAAIRDRRRLRRLWQHTRDPRHRIAFSRAADHCSTLLREHRFSKWEDFLLSLDERSCPWKATRILTRETPPLSPLQSPQGLVFSEHAKANLLASHFEQHFTNDPADSHPDEADIIGRVNDILLTPTPMHLPPFSKQEVSETISRINVKKAPGPDQITGSIIKNAPPLLIDHLLVLFNAILATQHFPSQWKLSKLFVLLKAGKPPTQPNSYRPISLLPILSKVFERLLLSRIRSTVDEFIRPEQFGFRSECSTTLQLLKFCTHLSDTFNRREHTIAVLIDFRAAFDTVWHYGLLYKMSGLFPPHMIKLFHSYLSGRSFFVTSRSPHFKNITSRITAVSAGVPQGSVLGPLLYSIFINDLPTTPNIRLGLYADDTVIYSSKKSMKLAYKHVQSELNQLSTWCSSWKIQINTGKCEAIAFSRKRKLPSPLHINQTPLPWQTSVRYLGITLDRTLTFTSHTTQALTKGRALLSKLYPLLVTPSLPLTVKVLIYTAIIRSAILYAAPVWYPFLSTTNKARFSRFQNRVLRTVCNFHHLVPNTLIYQHLQFTHIQEFIQTTSRTLHDTAQASSRETIHNMYTRQHPPPRFKINPLTYP